MIEKVLDILEKVNSRLEHVEDKLEKVSLHRGFDKIERRAYFAVTLVVVLSVMVGISYKDGLFAFNGAELVGLVKVLGSSSVILGLVGLYLKTRGVNR